MLAALLQGRSQFSFGEMRHRNHNLLYTHTLGVLELLQPYLFNPQYTEAWEAIVESYCELIRVMSASKILKIKENLKWCSFLLNSEIET